MAATDTPLMRQYTEIKNRHKDSLLLFRMGDFYELFFEDARVAAGVLDIALTSRNKNDPDPVPMCGVPHHSAASYIGRLVNAGHKVAICEQLEDPVEAKGIVRRDVIRVVSPGLPLDPESLEAKAPNFTHAAFPLPREGGVAWAACDFTTGRFVFGICESRADWLSRVAAQEPAELLLPDSAEGESLGDALRETLPRAIARSAPAFYFEARYAADRLSEQFGATKLAAIHPRLALQPLAAGPAGALLKHFQETQKMPRVPAITRLEQWGEDGAMELDAATVRALELFPSRQPLGAGKDTSLLGFLDRTRTAMGGRLLRDWLLRPLTAVEPILERQGEVAGLLAQEQALNPILSEIQDLERLLSRLSVSGGATATARELFSCARSVVKAAELDTALATLPAREGLGTLRARLARACVPELARLARETLDALVAELPATTREGGLFRKGYHPGLDALIELSENGSQWLAGLEARERQSTGIASLKVRFNRVFGYYIEVTKANLAAVPGSYIRKQTMVGGERFITEELKAFEERILTAEKKRCDMEHALFRDFCGRFTRLAPELAELARAVARVDAIAALARVAGAHGYVRPVVDGSLELDIVDGRHPTVSALMEAQASASAFVPNSVRLAPENAFLLITGPNMGGKSTVMRQTALITLLAQMGSFVPAASARVGIVDRVFTRIGSADNIAEGSSTFMVEMSEMSFILRNASPRSLILIDEIGRGTSTYDGMSLAWALAADLASRVRARTLFATHYHELTKLAERVAGVRNARMAVEVRNEGGAHSEVRFLYRLEPGVAERSYGIQVARMAGLPEPVLDAASAVLSRLEARGAAPHSRVTPPRAAARPTAPGQLPLF